MNLGDKKPGKTPTKRPLYVYYIIVGVIIVLLNILVVPAIQERSIEKTDYSTFIKSVEKGNVTRATIEEGYIYYEVKSPKTGNTLTCKTVQMDDPDLVNRLLDADVVMDEVLPESPSIFFTLILSYVIPIGIFIFLGRWLSRKMMSSMGNGGPGGAMSFGKSNAKVYVKSSTGIKFSDVAGEDEAKELLTEIVDYLHNPQKYTEIGASMPKGALLVGPPGTGKTLLAKAVAGEAEVPFFSISGSEFVEMFVGMGAAKVRDLFKQANEKAPCIVFIDEIDAVARRRGTGMGGGHDEREQTLNQLLVEMDGFGVNEGIIVMAATNRVDILDPAILRPGRFDRKISVGTPDVGGREDILKLHARNKPLAENVNLKQVAQTTAGFTGADLENLLNEAAILAAEADRVFVAQEDIQRAFIKVGIGSEKRSRIISDEEKKITAYHESGHAILFHVLPDVGPVYTVSIIPTGIGAAGYTMPLPERDDMFMTRGRLEEEIMVSLGGRIAEQLIFDDITTGASSDIKKATKLARKMVTRFGMSDNIGVVCYDDDDDEVFIGRDLAHAKSHSELISGEIDKEVKEIIDRCYSRAKDIILENMEVLHKSAQLLLQKEKITREEFEALFQKEKPFFDTVAE